jgi:hypothetical protein
MRRLFGWGAAIVIPALAAAILVGCGGGTKPDDDEDDGGSKSKSSGTKSGGGSTLAALEAKYNGTLTGKVTIETKPNLAKLTEDLQALMKTKEDCSRGTPTPLEKDQQGWRIDDKGGVGNVFVWLVPPKGKFFTVDMGKKTWQEKVVLDQPHCAFVPHAMVVFPKYRDEKGKLVPTGQVFQVVNSAEFNHNTNVTDGPNSILPAHTTAEKGMVIELQPSNKPVEIKCNIHTWMNAFALAQDHPFVALTNPDGTYKIENVPTGVEVQVIAWHEKAGYLNTDAAKGQKVTLKEKDELNFTAKAP